MEFNRSVILTETYEWYIVNCNSTQQAGDKERRLFM